MNNFQFDYKAYKTQILKILKEVYDKPLMEGDVMRKFLQQKAKISGRMFSKNDLLFSLKELQKETLLIKETQENETEILTSPNLSKNLNINQDQSFESNNVSTQNGQTNWLFDPNLVKKLLIKPTRTISGVTPVTVLTKPFPCPGQCIFCPNDLRMPKSYLSDEPGAQRAERNGFDPYLQTFGRLKALQNIGHEVNKVELIVLGGTWSFYPETYQIWFIKRCFDALNDFSEKKETEYQELLAKIGDPNYRHHSKNMEVIRNVQNTSKPFEGKASQTYNQIISDRLKNEEKTPYILTQKATWQELFVEQEKNETVSCRCVGLVIETRPDKISPKEVIRIRKLGCTKTQIGFQSLNDEVLKLNHRGHNVNSTRYAVKLLRLAGFKIHAHWMANLYGSDPKKDQLDFAKMFEEGDFRPDELKVYPCSLLHTAELMDYYRAGLWKPYTQEELLEVMVFVMTKTPVYCRLTRIIRDIPSTDIVVGNKKTNFREIAQKELQNQNLAATDIRAREIRNKQVIMEDLELKGTWYNTNVGSEIFLEFVTKQKEIAGFLRLFLPFLGCNQKQIYEERLLKQIEFLDLSKKENLDNLESTNPDLDTDQNQKINLNLLKVSEISKSSDSTKKFMFEEQKDILTSFISSKQNLEFYPNTEFLKQIKVRKIDFDHPFLPELNNSGVIREVHVYGQSVKVGDKSLDGKAQHLGLGSKLVEFAQKIATKIGYQKIAVISSIGTRKYYQKFGFEKEGLYQTKNLENT